MDKNVAHFLVHCKNLGLLRDLDVPDRALVSTMVAEIDNFVAAQGEEINFAESDAQACLDVLLYGQHVLGLEVNEDSQVALARLIPNREQFLQTQEAIFHRILKFLGHKRKGEGEWTHAVPAGRLQRMVFGDVIAVEMEGAYIEKDGVVLKREDIVIRNTETGEILFVVVVDGPSHLYAEGKKSGKTKARDEFVKAIVGEDKLIVIGLDDFELFKSLKPDEENTSLLEDKLAFLKEVKVLIAQRMLAVERESQAQKESAFDIAEQVAVKAASVTPASSQIPSIAPVASALAPKAVKTEEQIRAELQRELWYLLQNDPLNIEEILADKRFATISVDSIKSEDGLNPFDFMLRKFNSADEDSRADIRDALKLLWVYGFQNEDKALVDVTVTYPEDLKVMLGINVVKAKEERSVDVKALSRNAILGKFSIVRKMMERDGLPSKLDDRSKETFVLVARFAIREGAQGSGVLQLMKDKTWFGDIEKEVFIKALEADDETIITFFLKQKGREFFQEIFRANEALLVKVRDSQCHSAVVRQLTGHIETDFDLVDKMAQCILSSTTKSSADLNVEQAARRVLRSEDDSPSLLNTKGMLFLYGLFGASQDPERAARLFQEAIDKDPNLREARVNLARAYKELGCKKEAVDICKALVAEGRNESVDAEAHFILYVLETDYKSLKKAAELEYPRALGLTAVFHYSGKHGFKLDKDEGIKLAQRATELGDGDSWGNLGVFYVLQHHSNSREADEATRRKALDCFRRGVIHKSAISSLNLAINYDKGWDVAEDPKQALRLYKSALEWGLEDDDQVAMVRGRISEMTRGEPGVSPKKHKHRATKPVVVPPLSHLISTS